ncbi:MAG TPA: general stress protein [Intrasporangium sp.]|nr:general stress protein [Intrasporangium sp.]
MSMQPKGPGQRPGFATLSLEYPMSLGVFDKYEDAQRAVDTLSDKGFPVQNCLIVGTDLKQLERVTARLTWGRVILAGVLSGLWLGLFVGLIFALFNRQESAFALLISCALYGALFGLIWSVIGYAFTRGTRDFQSVSQVVATKYEVFVEHKYAQQGRDILAQAGILGQAQTVYVPSAGSAADPATSSDADRYPRPERPESVPPPPPPVNRDLP